MNMNLKDSTENFNWIMNSCNTSSLRIVWAWILQQDKVTKENRICTLFIMKVLLMEKVRAPAVLSLVKPDNILSR